MQVTGDRPPKVPISTNRMIVVYNLQPWHPPPPLGFWCLVIFYSIFMPETNSVARSLQILDLPQNVRLKLSPQSKYRLRSAHRFVCL